MLRLQLNLPVLILLLSFSNSVLSQNVKYVDFYGIQLGQTKQEIKNELKKIKSNRLSGIVDKKPFELEFYIAKHNVKNNLLLYFDKYQNNSLFYVKYKKKYEMSHLSYNELYNTLVLKYGNPDIEKSINGAILKTLCWGDACNQMDELVKLKGKTFSKNKFTTKITGDDYALVITFIGTLDKVNTIFYQLVGLSKLVQAD